MIVFDKESQRADEVWALRLSRARAMIMWIDGRVEFVSWRGSMGSGEVEKWRKEKSMVAMSHGDEEEELHGNDV